MPILAPSDGPATPSSLFSLAELATYMQAEVDDERATLLANLAGALISEAVGRTYPNDDPLPPMLSDW